MNGPILVILPHNPGDVVMALQAVRRVKAEFPGLEVDYLVGEECRDLVQGSPLIRKAIPIPKRALKERWNAGDDAGLMDRLESFLAELTSVRYALSANLFQERSGALLQSLIHADAKIGLELVDDTHLQVRSRFLEHLFAIPADRGGNAWHVVDIYVRALMRALMRALGAAPRRAKPQRRAENAASLLPPLIRPEVCKPLAPGGYLAFHPGSAWVGKRWPESHWADLATQCIRAGFTVAFTGSPEEKAAMQRILAAIDPAACLGLVDCVGATTLAGAAWVCSHARMVVTGDTVAMHLAAAAGVPTLSLFGASNPVETGPYGKGHVILQTDLNPLPDLAFDKEHPGLAHLRADEVAGYLLEGIVPPGFAMWETGWDETERRQTLSDAKRLPHPNLERAKGLMRTLDQDMDQADGSHRAADGSHRAADGSHRAADGSQPGEAGNTVIPAPDPYGPLEKLRAALETCQAEPKAHNLSALEAAEREWAADSQANLVWEAYRIAVNGLPVGDLRAHLAARKARFGLALLEEARSQARER